ncbi:MAG: hypothetical protein WDN27_06180 [Candidatus Saccharibacteria bacterium]
MTFALYYLASTYGSGAYDSGTYNGAAATSGSGLTDTGIAIAAIVDCGCPYPAHCHGYPYLETPRQNQETDIRLRLGRFLASA